MLRMASSVLLLPVPASTLTRAPATSTHSWMTRLCSSQVSVGDSPVVPQGTRPVMPFWTWNSTLARKAASSHLAPSPLPVKGVTRAVKAPCGSKGLLMTARR